MSIAVFDTDVLIFIFENQYSGNRQDFSKTMKYFQTKFNAIWIPTEVRREFAIKPSLRKRLQRIMKNHPDFLQMCPITTSKHERDIIINSIDIGEADAIIQIQKASSMKRYSFRSFEFISQDKKALQFAENSGFVICPYLNLKHELNEMGIVI